MERLGALRLIVLPKKKFFFVPGWMCLLCIFNMKLYIF